MYVYARVYNIFASIYVYVRVYNIASLHQIAATTGLRLRRGGTIHVLILLYMCPHTATGRGGTIHVLILLYMCPHTATYAASSML
jgi:hypothetical protein